MPKFEACKNFDDISLPKRSTTCSAGYDFYAAESVELPSIWSQIWRLICRKEIEPTIIHTHVKAKMKSNEVLLAFNRSSNPFRGMILANGVGVIDADYYSNPDNDGDIGFAFYNLMPWKVLISKGQKIGQGIFMTYRKTEDDSASGSREGGFGSTGK